MYHYPDFPDHVYVELTNICNARCTICATPGMKRKRAIMPLGLFTKIARECGQRRARKFLPFLHGESLLVPGVTDYFRTMRRLAPETHINLTTNGSKLSAELGEEILQDELLDSMIVSFDGADKETYEKIRLNLDWDEVRSNVLRFIRRRNELGKAKPKISVAMVTIQQNKHQRKEFERIWSEADEVRFSVYFNWAGQLENNGRTSYKVNFCERLHHYITILADGRVALCCFDSEAAYTVGSVREHTIHQVWHSDAFNERRRQLYRRDFKKLPICGNCDYLNHPRWMSPLIRIRPYMQRSLPALTTAAEKVYKNWLFRD
ncbi:MAG: radical SAM/SPASM domain-containing protein [Acidobacteriota bacterium]